MLASLPVASGAVPWVWFEDSASYAIPLVDARSVAIRSAIMHSTEPIRYWLSVLECRGLPKRVRSIPCFSPVAWSSRSQGAKSTRLWVSRVTDRMFRCYLRLSMFRQRSDTDDRRSRSDTGGS